MTAQAVPLYRYFSDYGNKVWFEICTSASLGAQTQIKMQQLILNGNFNKRNEKMTNVLSVTLVT
jgi:hypothetical protein